MGYAICQYKADVGVDYEEDIKTPLSVIEAKYVAFKDQLLDFYKELNKEAHTERVKAWDENLLSLKQEFKQNAREVKLKAKKLKEEAKT